MLEFTRSRTALKSKAISPTPSSVKLTFCNQTCHHAPNSPPPLALFNFVWVATAYTTVLVIPYIYQHTFSYIHKHGFHSQSPIIGGPSLLRSSHIKLAPGTVAITSTLTAFPSTTGLPLTKSIDGGTMIRGVWMDQSKWIHVITIHH